MVNKTERGVMTYKIIKTAGMSKIGSKSDNNQLDNDRVESILPDKSVIDRYVD
jgi:hypothetical protein